jgi:hypothetical protein
MAEFTDKLKQVTSTQSVDDQAITFLRAFVADFSGRFEEVLTLAEEFKKYGNPNDTKIRDLDEFQAHLFLEKRGETKTVTDLREQLKAIDLDSNNRLAFIEYLLFKYNKTLKDLFTASPSAALIAKLEKAIAQYKAVFEEKRQRAEKIAELERQVAQGGPQAARAKAELKRLQGHNPDEDGKNEIGALAAKLQAKRALANPEEEQKRLYEEEQRRLAEEQRRKEEEERRKKQESRNRLKERAALWK